MWSRLSQNSRTLNNFYGYRALEIVSINIMSCLDNDFEECFIVGKQSLLGLEDEVNGYKIRELSIKSKNLSFFYQNVFLIRDVLDHLLGNNDDMAIIYT